MMGMVHGRRRLNVILCLLILIPVAPMSTYAAYTRTGAGSDRAVEIAMQAKDRVERNGKLLKESSHDLFKDFAERTVALQNLIDTRQDLERAGFLNRDDPDGQARRAHINGKILVEVGALKTICDQHLDKLLASLERFDETVASSIIDAQATRSINSNYELNLDQYLKHEKTRFEQASQDAEASLREYEEATNDRQKKRYRERYNRAKKRLIQIEQRRRLYQARLQGADMNQKITALIREKIREEGHDIPTRFRQVMADLYNTFSKITPIAEVGGTDSPEILANLGFSNMTEIRSTLVLVDGAIGKLGGVLDDMVNDVISGLDEITVVSGNGISTEAISVEEEMEFLRQQRETWEG
ncbi:hypothetical protein DSCO28_65870 [Desulfosarcina ovata subsp. sediminis]|uniref:Uncharacterized protein n=2 Tax=Desulfosarcina ovata TaxID=83564 RepID=A0A5K8A0U0_9BACT|nr:hypothetical protein DSCO28_65870 [Desulfosarcina ovata subsp. sediminis]